MLKVTGRAARPPCVVAVQRAISSETSQVTYRYVPSLRYSRSQSPDVEVGLKYLRFGADDHGPSGRVLDFDADPGQQRLRVFRRLGKREQDSRFAIFVQH
jgi:hypothetical protein